MSALPPKAVIRSWPAQWLLLTQSGHSRGSVCQAKSAPRIGIAPPPERRNNAPFRPKSYPCCQWSPRLSQWPKIRLWGPGCLRKRKGRNRRGRCGRGVDPVCCGIGAGRRQPREKRTLFSKNRRASGRGPAPSPARAVQASHLTGVIWEKWLGVVLRAATAMVGIACGGGFGFMVWDAAHSNGSADRAFPCRPTWRRGA